MICSDTKCWINGLVRELYFLENVQNVIKFKFFSKN